MPAYGISNEIWLVRAIPLKLGDLRAMLAEVTNNGVKILK
jgi:hypothetical protein